MQFSIEREPIPARPNKGVDVGGKRRITQRCWKEQRKTKYHRFAGMSHKQVKKVLDLWIKFEIEKRLKVAGLEKSQ